MATTHGVEPRTSAAERGLVARHSSGEWGMYHRPDCALAPRSRDAGIRSIIRGPWRYLAQHWAPCPECRPPAGRDLSG